MAEQATVIHQVTLLDKTFNTSYNIFGSKFAFAENVITAAKAGILSTRTDANTGVLTLGVGHGVTNGQRLDLYWDGGYRYGMVVGSVSGVLVPIDLGAGTDLPVVNTEITCMVPTQDTFSFVGNDMTALMMFAAFRGLIIIADNSDNLVVRHFRDNTPLPSQYDWCNKSGLPNPLAAQTPTKIFMSHADSAQTRTLRAAALYTP